MITIATKPILIKTEQKIEPILFETIKFINGEFFNLEYHQERVDRAFKEFFRSSVKLNLKKELEKFKFDYKANQIYRIKVIYDASGVKKIEYFEYKQKRVSKIKLVEMPNVNYRYKYLNRDFLNSLNTLEADEFIICQNGFLKDTTIANIALFNRELQEWHTPREPLLFGTTLKRYLSKNRLKATDISYLDLKRYSKLALLNAMVDWLEFDIKRIENE